MKIIIIGATSGIGKSLAAHYSQAGHDIGITGRRTEMLTDVEKDFPNTTIYSRFMDVAKVEKSRLVMDELINEMGGCDLIIINAGVGFVKANYKQELQTLDVNARGFMSLANWSYEYFKKQGKGHLVGVSSLAGLRSSLYAPEYHATKAFMSSYLEGLRYRSAKWHKEIVVTDIRPGFVETAMTEQNDKMFWVAKPKKAAKQIATAIKKKKKVAYITKRYVIIAFLLKVLPDWVYTRVM